MRLDRLITLYLFRPLARQQRFRGLRIPILMYHSICDEKEKGHPYFWVNTSPARFAEHMRYLHDNNYHVISLIEAVELIYSQKARDPRYPTPRQPSASTPRVVLTFDDGYRDFYTHAFPLLRQCGFAATVFLPTDFIGNGRPGLCCKEHLIWEEVRELAGQGITFGSHTHTHPQLKGLSRSTIVQELRRSRNIIEDKLGSAVTEFSYPYRFPEENVEFKKFFVGELTKAGYICGVTTSIGRYRAGDDAIFIKRLPVNSDDDKAFLEAKLKGNYDWLHTPQYLVKQVRSRVR